MKKSKKFSIVIPHKNPNSRVTRISESIASGIELSSGCKAIICPARSEHGYSNLANILPELAESDGIIFGSPTFFGSVSAEMKEFFDATVPVFQSGGWRNKIAAGFTHSSAPSGDKLSTLNTINIFAAQHGMIWVGLDIHCGEALNEKIEDKLSIKRGTSLNLAGSWLGYMSSESALCESDMATARYMGYRIANVLR